MKTTKVPVSQRAIILRINRKLRDEGERLCATRGEQALQELGPFHVVNERSNTIAKKRFDLEAYARELGALQEWEALAP